MQDKSEKKPFDRSGSTMKHIRFEDELLEQINGAAGKGNFSSWVKDACRQRLRNAEPKG
ncbi:YlcI/YnfO family protein [Enterobacter roggenkampii]|uniref:YlcI/YnfO family protein n=1 Tax=Enterobacter roggenkampii TaxID=1812935 RepID=UPI002FE55763